MSLIKAFFKKNWIILVVLAYFIITIVFTFPVILDMNTKTAFWDSDGYQVIARVNDQKDLFEKNGVLSGLLSIVGKGGFHIVTLYGLIAVFVGTFLSINLMLWFSLIFSGLGCYLLVYYFTKNHLASFLSGLIFSLAPFHLHQSLSINVGSMHQEFLPFFVLFLLKFFEKFQFKYFIFSGIFALLIGFADVQLFAFTVVFVFIFLIYKLFQDKQLLKNKKFLLYLGGSLLFFLIIMFTFFVPLLKISLSENNYLNPGIEQAERYSINFLDPIAPPVFNSFLSGFNTFIQEIVFLDGAREKGSYFIGFLSLFLIIYFIFKIKKNKDNLEFKEKTKKWFVWFWLIVLVVFYIFALGPYKEFGDFKIYLPYYLIYEYIPFFENIRTVGRFFIFSMLAVSVLAGFGLVFFLEKKKNLEKIKILFIAVVIVFFEFLAIPLPVSSIEISDFYHKIAKEEEKFSIIEIPGSTSYEFASFQMITKNIHNKGIMNGIAFARTVPGEFAIQKTVPPFRQLLYKIPKGNSIDEQKTLDIINESFLEYSTEVLSFYNVKYITFNKNYLSKKKIKTAIDFIEKYISAEKFYEDDSLIVYKVLEGLDENKKVLIFVNTESDHWGRDREDKNNIVYRSIDSDAPMFLINLDKKKESKNVEISMDLMSKNDLNVSIVIKGEEAGICPVKKDWSVCDFKLEDVDFGEGEFILRVLDSEGNKIFTDDKKDEGVRISNIKIK